MIRSQVAIDQIAERIERAYRRKYPRLVTNGPSAGVWASAAARLLEAPEAYPGHPVDPELFVAVQVRSRLTPDPWAELTQSCSVDRYHEALRRIIRRLRRELRTEVRRAERRLLRGEALDRILETEGRRISPLACYILAYRSGRDELAFHYRALALRQHQSCPLYQEASSPLLSCQAYPSDDRDTRTIHQGRVVAAFSTN